MSEENKEAPDKGKADPEAAFTKLLDKHANDGIALARLLHGENHDLRQKNADLRGKVPTDGSVVLTGEQVKEWSAYQALGKPDDLRKTVREHPELAQKVSAFEREKEVADIGSIAGMKPSVLQLLADRDKVTFEVKDGKDDKGKPTQTVMVKVGDALTPIDEYADKHWADLLPSLKPESGTTAKAPARGTPSFDVSRGNDANRTPPANQRQDINPIEAQVRTDLAGLF